MTICGVSVRARVRSICPGCDAVFCGIQARYLFANILLFDMMMTRPTIIAKRAEATITLWDGGYTNTSHIKVYSITTNHSIVCITHAHMPQRCFSRSVNYAIWPIFSGFVRRNVYFERFALSATRNNNKYKHNGQMMLKMRACVCFLSCVCVGASTHGPIVCIDDCAETGMGRIVGGNAALWSRLYRFVLDCVVRVCEMIDWIRLFRKCAEIGKTNRNEIMYTSGHIKCL